MKKTDREVDKAVFYITTHCLDDFSCLSGDKTCLCDVVNSNEKDIVALKSKPTIKCKYFISLKSSAYCHCLTRAKIYHSYKMGVLSQR
jgi:hypothetical protein